MHIDVIVVGTHEYEWALWPFAELFAKYYGSDNITYVGDRREGELPSNMEFMQVPCYSEGVWPWEHWFGNGFNSIMEYYEGDIVLMFLPDQWLCAPVWKKPIYALAQYMAKHTNTVRGHITAGSDLYNYGTVVDFSGDFPIWAVSPGNKHVSLAGGVALCSSLWNPANAMKIIDPGWTPWECEVYGTKRMREEFPSLRSVGIRPVSVHCAPGLSRHNMMVDLTGLGLGDQRMVAEYVPDEWNVL